MTHESPGQEMPASDVAASADLHVLLVEGREANARSIDLALAAAGLRIPARRVDTPSALRAALADRAWDILLCDPSQPGLELAEVLDLSRADAPGLPVVAVFDTAGEEMVADMMRQGVADVVPRDRMAAELGLVVIREGGRARSLRRAETQRRHIAAVLDVFQATPDWHTALETSLRLLARSFGADIAVIVELDQAESPLRSIARWAQPGLARMAAGLCGAEQPASTTAVGQAVRDGRTMIGTADLGMARPMAVIVQSLVASGRRFGLVMTFPTAQAASEPDLADVAAQLAAIAAALQPVLFHKIGDAERRLLSNALDAAVSGVLITEATLLDPPGPRIVYANEAMRRMTGYDPLSLIGQTPRILQSDQTDRATLDRLRAALERAEPVEVELLNRRRDGTPFMVELSITPVRERGRVTHFIAIQTDVTERRRAEAALRSRDESFRLLFDNNPMPMWVYDVETLAFLEVNNAAVERYGWSRAEFLDRSVVDIRPVEHQAGFRQNIVREATAHRTIPSIHVTKAGERMDVRVAVHDIDYQGRAARLAAIWDVTEMERARDALRRKNAELGWLTETLRARTDELLDASHLAGIGTWTMEWVPRRVVWSAETYAILGQDPDSFVLDTPNILNCIHPDDREIVRDAYRGLRGHSVGHEIEYRILRPSGEMRVVRELARTRFDAQGKLAGMSGVIQDITEHKQAEDALLRSEKLKTLGQITGGIAHDFNNLLTVIGLNIETALIDDALPEDLRSLLEPALRATERGSELTRQMLTYARRPSLRPVVVDLRKLLEALRPLLVRGVGDRLDLRLVLPDAAVPVRLDPGQFENALLNLAINARDAMPDGGTVTITVSAEMVQHALQRVPDLVPAGPQAVVRVTDTGHGISAEVLPRIVEPFFTTKALGKGSGLGLSMVYGFIHQSGGSFSMLSEPGVGTTMELYFPLSEAEGTVAVAASAGLGVRQRSGNALLVEDRADLRAAMHRVLEQIGFTACSVGSAAAALEIVQAPGALDLLICDVTLPGRMDGPMLAAAAQAMRPNLPILLISGATQIVEEDAPKWPFLPKPFRVSDIAAALDLLEQG